MLIGRYIGLVEARWVGGILLVRMDTCSQTEMMEYEGCYDHQGTQVYFEKNALSCLIVILYLKQSRFRYQCEIYKYLLSISLFLRSTFSQLFFIQEIISSQAKKGLGNDTCLSVNLTFPFEWKYWMQSKPTYKLCSTYRLCLYSVDSQETRKLWENRVQSNIKVLVELMLELVCIPWYTTWTWA